MSFPQQNYNCNPNLNAQRGSNNNSTAGNAAMQAWVARNQPTNNQQQQQQQQQFQYPTNTGNQNVTASQLQLVQQRIAHLHKQQQQPNQNSQDVTASQLQLVQQQIAHLKKQQQQPNQNSQHVTVSQIQLIQQQMAHLKKQQQQLKQKRDQNQNQNQDQNNMNNMRRPAQAPPHRPVITLTPQLQQLQQLQKLQKQQQLQQQQQQRPSKTSPPQGWQAMPPPRWVTTTRVIAMRMHSLAGQQSAIAPSSEFWAAYARLPMAYKYVISNTMVFQFSDRPSLPSDGKRNVAPDAWFYLEKLHQVSSHLVERPKELAGLRCACCFSASDQQYIAGSTNFVELSHHRVHPLLLAAMRGRLKHMMSCPGVPKHDKGLLFAYKPNSDPGDAKLMVQFLTEWGKVLINSHYQFLYPKVAHQQHKHQHKAHQQSSPLVWQALQWARRKHPNAAAQNNIRNSGMATTAQSMEDASYGDLLDSFLAARQMRNAAKSEIVFDNLADGSPVRLDGKETPLMESFLQNFQIRLVVNKGQVRIRVHCGHCQSNSDNTASTNAATMDTSNSSNNYYCISQLLAKNNKDSDHETDDYERLSNNLWSFVCRHICHDCKTMPSPTRRLFLQQREEQPQPSSSSPSSRSNTSKKPPHDNLKVFLKAWKTHLHKILRWTMVSSMEPKEDVELYMPVTLELLKKHGPLLLEWKKGPSAKRQPNPVAVQVNPHDVIVGSEAHRELEGNRRFRQLISEHRPLYSKVALQQQGMMIATIVQLIGRRGGKFCEMYEGSSNAYHEISLAQRVDFVNHALKKGFPEMLREPIMMMSGGNDTTTNNNNNKASKVMDVEYPPMIGRLHGNIRWENSDPFMQPMKLADYKLKGASAKEEDSTLLLKKASLNSTATEQTRTTQAGSSAAVPITIDDEDGSSQSSLKPEQPFSKQPSAATTDDVPIEILKQTTLGNINAKSFSESTSTVKEACGSSVVDGNARIPPENCTALQMSTDPASVALPFAKHVVKPSKSLQPARSENAAPAPMVEEEEPSKPSKISVTEASEQEKIQEIAKTVAASTMELLESTMIEEDTLVRVVDKVETSKPSVDPVPEDSNRDEIPAGHEVEMSKRSEDPAPENNNPYITQDTAIDVAEAPAVECRKPTMDKKGTLTPVMDEVETATEDPTPWATNRDIVQDRAADVGAASAVKPVERTMVEKDTLAPVVNEFKTLKPSEHPAPGSNKRDVTPQTTGAVAESFAENDARASVAEEADELKTCHSPVRRSVDSIQQAMQEPYRSPQKFALKHTHAVDASMPIGIFKSVLLDPDPTASMLDAAEFSKPPAGLGPATKREAAASSTVGALELAQSESAIARQIRKEVTASTTTGSLEKGCPKDERTPSLLDDVSHGTTDTEENPQDTSLSTTIDQSPSQEVAGLQQGQATGLRGASSREDDSFLNKENAVDPNESIMVSDDCRDVSGLEVDQEFQSSRDPMVEQSLKRKINDCEAPKQVVHTAVERKGKKMSMSDSKVVTNESPAQRSDQSAKRPRVDGNMDLKRLQDKPSPVRDSQNEEMPVRANDESISAQLRGSITDKASFSASTKTVVAPVAENEPKDKEKSDAISAVLENGDSDDLSGVGIILIDC